MFKNIENKIVQPPTENRAKRIYRNIESSSKCENITFTCLPIKIRSLIIIIINNIIAIGLPPVSFCEWLLPGAWARSPPLPKSRLLPSRPPAAAVSPHRTSWPVRNSAAARSLTWCWAAACPDRRRSWPWWARPWAARDRTRSPGPGARPGRRVSCRRDHGDGDHDCDDRDGDGSREVPRARGTVTKIRRAVSRRTTRVSVACYVGMSEALSRY